MMTRKNRMTDLIVELSLGKSMKDIASEWGVSAADVQYWWSRARKSLGFRCYQDATRYAIKKGMITL